VRFLSVIFRGAVSYGAWGRHGRILTSGLDVSVADNEINLRPITSKGVVSNACVIRIPMVDRDAVVKALKALS
jgi:hypothetical protein